MAYITTHFRTEEFACPCCGKSAIDPNLVKQVLQEIRDRFKRPVIITEGGGYRCRNYNVRIRSCSKCSNNYHGMLCPQCNGPGVQRSAKWSRHMMGTEADIVVPMVEPEAVASFAETIKIVRNIGRYWNFTHVGIGGNSNHRWDMR